MVASYSGLYEEGEVEHINCPHPPSPQAQSAKKKKKKKKKGGANPKANEQHASGPYIARWKVGGWAVQELMNLIKLQI